jgi:hypothetical protein
VFVGSYSPASIGFSQSRLMASDSYQWNSVADSGRPAGGNFQSMLTETTAAQESAQSATYQRPRARDDRGAQSSTPNKKRDEQDAHRADSSVATSDQQPSNPKPFAWALTGSQFSQANNGSDQTDVSDSVDGIQQKPGASAQTPAPASDLSAQSTENGAARQSTLPGVLAFEGRLLDPALPAAAQDAQQAPASQSTHGSATAQATAAQAVKPMADTKSSGRESQNSDAQSGGNQGTKPATEPPGPTTGAPDAKPFELKAPATSPAPATAAAHELPQEVEAGPASAAPARDLTLRVHSDDQQTVDLRMVERGGEIRVSVHSSAPDLANTLQQGLGELSRGLDQKGIRAEFWAPSRVTAVADTKSSADTRQGSEDSLGQSGNQSGKWDQSRQQRQNRNQSAWEQTFQ